VRSAVNNYSRQFSLCVHCRSFFFFAVKKYISRRDGEKKGEIRKDEGKGMKDDEFGIQNECDLCALSALCGKLLSHRFSLCVHCETFFSFAVKKKIFTTEDTADTEKKGKRNSASFTSPR
jgi:hypothetical protein